MGTTVLPPSLNEFMLRATSLCALPFYHVVCTVHFIFSLYLVWSTRYRLRFALAPLSTRFSQYGDAEPLLRALGGAAAPEGFQGGLDFTYTVGPSSVAVVKMVVENEEHVGPVWNVIGMVPGTLPEKHDRPVVLGNHRDAWVFGAVGEVYCDVCVSGGRGRGGEERARNDGKEVRGCSLLSSCLLTVLVSASSRVLEKRRPE